MLELIQSVQKDMAILLPSFYIDFLVNKQLVQSKLFSELTLLYGIEDLHKENQSSEVHYYLPGYICIGNNSGDYGFFISIRSHHDRHIYVCGLGDLDESSLEKMADSFELWEDKNYASEDFLETLYQNQFTSPLKQLRGDLQQLELQQRQLKAEKDTNAIDLKTYLLKKRAFKPAIDGTIARLIALETRQKNYKNPPISLANLEQRHQFKFPILYKKLYYDGMLDWGRFGQHWASEVLPMLIKSPPLLLFAKEFELIHLRDIDETIHGISEFHPTVNHRFIPFGMSGAGDIYAFHIDATHNESMPIVYIWHDDNRCDYLARDLQDFIFLKMLDAIHDIDEEHDMITSGDLRTNLEKWLITHKKYLKDTQVAILETSFKNDIQVFKHIDEKGRSSNYVGLISSEDYDTIMEKEINFSLLNTSFKYSPDT
jgi:hypothetical protein